MENIVVVFGGRSVEHEVSVITGMQVVENMDKKYNAVPLYVTKEGKFLCGESLKNFKTFKQGDFSEAFEVFFKPQDQYLYREVTQKSGLFGKESKTLEKYIKVDCVFPALHGTYGEDGCFQGMLETTGVPYVGCGVMSAAVGMDKVIMKKVFESEGIPMTPYFYFYREDFENQEEIINKAEEIGYNLFVKPANLGSSIGISKVKNREELIEAIKVASSYDRKIIIEKAVDNPREINAAVLGYQNDLKVSELEEPIGWKDFLKFDEKYISGSKGGSKMDGMANQSKNLPANVTEEIKNQIQNYAKVAFRAIDGMGVAR
ncbi:MAG: D-alanine--D-alanine ligase family protein, partial [Peptoniphilus sp.]|uniref:D-alanine--D-alanine ligase family protein n=1 Tax=Peptoniphilus sp. TaxID=1971214 RepID=UPI002A74C962